MTPSLYVKAVDLALGDTMLLPFNKEATITDLKPVGPRTKFVQFKTEFGWSRIGVNESVHVKAQVLA